MRGLFALVFDIFPRPYPTIIRKLGIRRDYPLVSDFLSGKSSGNKCTTDVGNITIYHFGVFCYG